MAWYVKHHSFTLPNTNKEHRSAPQPQPSAPSSQPSSPVSSTPPVNSPPPTTTREAAPRNSGRQQAAPETPTWSPATTPDTQATKATGSRSCAPSRWRPGLSPGSHIMITWVGRMISRGRMPGPCRRRVGLMVSRMGWLSLLQRARSLRGLCRIHRLGIDVLINGGLIRLPLCH